MMKTSGKKYLPRFKEAGEETLFFSSGILLCEFVLWKPYCDLEQEESSVVSVELIVIKDK
jgi:hypothetical protein